MGISYLTLLSNSNLLNLSYHNAKALATDFVGSADAQKSSAARRGCDDSDRRWRAAARHRRSESLRPQTNFPHLPVTRQPRTKVPPVCPCEPLCGLLRGRVASLPRRRISSRFRADLSKLSVRRKRSRRKALALFCANAYSQQPAVRAAARICGFWKLTLFSRFPERFDAKFEKSRCKALCHNGLRRRFDRKSVRFIPL